MSWYVSAKGRPLKVLEYIRGELERPDMAEPENSTKNNILKTIEHGLLSYPPSNPVEVVASGTQHFVGEVIDNPFEVKFSAIHSWVE